MAVLRDEDLEWLILDSTAVRAHPAAAGRKKWDGSGGREQQFLGRSRGGFGTKVHGSFMPFGYPVELALTPAQESGIKQAEGLLGGHRPTAIVPRP